MNRKNNKKFALSLLIISLIFLQCALLNAFYNAKIAFRTTRKEHIKFLITEEDTTVSVPVKIINGYDRTIAKCRKVLEIYNRKDKWQDNALFLKGKAEYYKHSYLDAIHTFSDLQSKYGESEFIPESYLFLAMAHIAREDYELAEVALDYILLNYPELDNDGEVTLLMVKVSISRSGNAHAIQELEKTLLTLKSDERKFEVLVQLSDLYMEMKMYKKCVLTVQKAPKTRDFPYKKYLLDMNLTRAYRSLNKDQLALDNCRKMLKDKKNVRYKPMILFEKGMALKALGNRKKSDAVFEDLLLLTTFNNIRGLVAFELAKNSQFLDGDFEKALLLYKDAERLVTDKDVLETIKLRIRGLELRAEYLTNIDSIIINDSILDTLKSDESRYRDIYKLGEVYWLNLSEPDSALNQFLLLAQDTLVDSIVCMKSNYGRAWILLNMKQDTVVADSIFNFLIRRYPATAIAKKAQEAMGLEVTIKTRRDSALIAYAKAEKLYQEDLKAAKAVNSFYMVYKNYSEMADIAASALYAGGWICDNILNKNEKALKFYRKLCKEFPNESLCKDEVAPKIKIVDDTLAVLKAMGTKGIDLVQDDEKVKNITDSSTILDSISSIKSEVQDSL